MYGVMCLLLFIARCPRLFLFFLAAEPLRASMDGCVLRASEISANQPKLVLAKQQQHKRER